MKTAPELGMTVAEHTSLRVVRDLLAMGTIEHVEGDPTNLAAFNMGVSCVRSTEGCGSIMCIGGWVKAIDLGFIDLLEPTKAKVDWGGSHDLMNYVASHDPESAIHELYHPSIEPWDKITAPMAVEAINNFLETGDAKWRDIGLRVGGFVVIPAFSDDEDL